MHYSTLHPRSFQNKSHNSRHVTHLIDTEKPDSKGEHQDITRKKMYDMFSNVGGFAKAATAAGASFHGASSQALPSICSKSSPWSLVLLFAFPCGLAVKFCLGPDTVIDRGANESNAESTARSFRLTWRHDLRGCRFLGDSRFGINVMQPMVAMCCAGSAVYAAP
jgi:hypothetical protein